MMRTAIATAAGLVACACMTVENPVRAQPTQDWPACGTVEAVPGTTWPAPDPESAGWNVAALEAARADWQTLDSAAVMVVHRGRLIASWGAVDERYTAQSIRKALLNSLIGHLVGDGRLSLDSTLEELGIDDSEPALTQAERQATVEHLMLSRSGIFHSAHYEVGGWKRMRQALQERKVAGEDFSPGRYWIYNNWDFNALGTIVEQAAGEPIGPLFSRLVAEPIGMEDFRAADVEYAGRDNPAEEFLGNSSDHPAYVFNISTRDLARYGLLYLNCGSWDGERVIPADWVRRSIVGVDTREGRGPDEQNTGFGYYGLLWQVDRDGRRVLYDLPFREPVYIGSGYRGHFLLVAPGLDLVIAHQVATEGGVGFEAQQQRALHGSPEVTDEDLQRLFRAIIAAHPEAETAFEE